METFNIVSIDPGNNIGISIFTVSLPDYKIINIETKFVILENNISKTAHDKILDRLQILSNLVTELITIYNPVAFSVEAAFLNVRFPKAVMQLSQYVAIIEHTMIQLNPYIKIFKYPPKYIKARSTGSGNADKDGMLLGLNKVKELSSKVNLNLVSEHEVDAVAIAYTALLEIRAYPFILYALW